MTDERVELREWCQNWLEENQGSGDVRWAPGYAEPGYDDAKHGVVLANWNNFDKRIEVADDSGHVHSSGKPDQLLEMAGYRIEWSDEWTDCCECNKIVRTVPDSYFWTPCYFWASECEIQCKACALADMDAYAAWIMEKQPNRLDPLNLPWHEHGWSELPSKFWYVLGITGNGVEPPTVHKAGEMDEAVLFVIVKDTDIRNDHQYAVWIKQP